jgi:hypothetical protein
MKNIVSFITKEQEKIMTESLPQIETYFAKDFYDFEDHLIEESIPIFSLANVDEKNADKAIAIVKNNLDKEFFILDKKNRETQLYEFELLENPNTGISPYSLDYCLKKIKQ